MRKLLPFLLLAIPLFAQNVPAPLSLAKKHELFDIRTAVNEDLKNFQKSSVMEQLNKDQDIANKAQAALNNSDVYKAAKKANDAMDSDVSKIKDSPEYKALQAKQDAFKKAQDAASSGVDLKKWQLDADFDWVPVPPVQSTQEKK